MTSLLISSITPLPGTQSTRMLRERKASRWVHIAWRVFFTEADYRIFPAADRPRTHRRESNRTFAPPAKTLLRSALQKTVGGCQRCCCNSCRSFYVDLSGTSMSAPHVTGLIALMLHKNPNLTHTEIKNLLTANFAPKPAGSTPDEDVGWGAGRADAKKTVDTVTQVNPPVSKVAAALPPVTALHKTFLETERGPILDKLFHDHADEVWELIQKNRRVGDGLASLPRTCMGAVRAQGDAHSLRSRATGDGGSAIH